MAHGGVRALTRFAALSCPARPVVQETPEKVKPGRTPREKRRLSLLSLANFVPFPHRCEPRP